MLIITEMTLGAEIIGRHKIIEVKIIEMEVEKITEMITEATIEMTRETTTKTITETTVGMTIDMTILEEIEVGLEKDNSQVIIKGMIKAVVDQDQVQGLVPVDRIRCYKCTEHDHFASDCPNSEEEEIE